MNNGFFSHFEKKDFKKFLVFFTTMFNKFHITDIFIRYTLQTLNQFRCTFLIRIDFKILIIGLLILFCYHLSLLIRYV